MDTKEGQSLNIKQIYPEAGAGDYPTNPGLAGEAREGYIARLGRVPDYRTRPRPEERKVTSWSYLLPEGTVIGPGISYKIMKELKDSGRHSAVSVRVRPQDERNENSPYEVLVEVKE